MVQFEADIFEVCFAVLMLERQSANLF